jgi:hypothetical protein
MAAEALLASNDPTSCGKLALQSLAGTGLERGVEQHVEEVRCTSRKLRLREGMQTEDLHPSCKRVGELRDQKHVGGAGEDEAAGSSIANFRPMIVNKLLETSPSIIVSAIWKNGSNSTSASLASGLTCGMP